MDAAFAPKPVTVSYTHLDVYKRQCQPRKSEWHQVSLRLESGGVSGNRLEIRVELWKH